MINTDYKQDALILPLAIKSDPRLFAFLKAGDLISGALIKKGANIAFIDLGKYGTGVVYHDEMLNARELLRNLNPGDTVQAKIVDTDNEQGFVELSLSEAGRQKAWGEITELREKDEPIAIKIMSANKGGLISEIRGIPAFLPVSQLSNDHYPKATFEEKEKILEELQKLVGEEIKVKIIDANSRSNKLVVSEREASEVSSREFVKNYSVGQIVEGIISGVADFGAFMKFTDNPAVEGLIHVSELDWRTVDNPKEIVKIDDVVRVKIIEIKDGKISLSLKALKSDPWQTVGELFREGQEVKGTIYATNPFGAIINLGGSFQGQLHVTEFGSIEEMKKRLSGDKEHVFIIESIKPEERRIALKLKA
ncbi:MAG: S1 RNA-binding domain-containing protein [Candidatus Jorgensenbacteria bacterium]|nr:S1 RNA-binding domain-containing protein [Candidatus Jorgensenbacteria bacterium]